MSATEREASVARLARRGVQPEGEIPAIEARIAAYEAKHQMTTEHLRTCLREATLKETSEASAWLFLDDVLKDLR